ncbi:MAG: hypothetical protein OXU85_05105 [Thaumarchaeota archaeon]|nr:hypothetical protein [Nitrososphaerota archaeon]
MPAGKERGGGKAVPGVEVARLQEEARYEAEVARLKADARGQGRLFEARGEELVAKYPKQAIAMCAGEVFVGKTPYEAAMKARRAHPDRASFFHLYGAGILWMG